ncbi:MAG: cyclic nucleotide-binding domain-containing protein [Candidatus Rokubacteria bacterium]|nr:cyclic nucleotide-binding domain-containing protein [Candidatus Rokubacteria bacterium]
MPESVAARAFIFGLISAASLPIGSLLAMFWTPRDRVVAALMAFGGGALLAALTLDLVGEAMKKGDFYPLAAGCLAGGALFVVLNQVVNDRGGFLRKAATTVSHLKRRKSQRLRRLFERISAVPHLRSLPPAMVRELLPSIVTRTYPKGAVIIHQGDPGDSVFIIEEGSVDIVDERAGGRKIAALGVGDVFGEMALLTGEARTATAVAAANARVWLIFKAEFDRLLATSPDLAADIRALATERAAALTPPAVDATQTDAWVDAAMAGVEAKIGPPSRAEIREAAVAHSGAPLAIWLGILLDGIPESLVIGSSLLHASISISLIAGLFLSNFPEALSSSVGMREQHYSRTRILLMWTSLMVFTGIGAYVGNVFFVEMPHTAFTLVEGLAAGAMLTMIAETMLPEAYHRGGGVTGMSTLLGFLAAIFFKTLE